MFPHLFLSPGFGHFISQVALLHSDPGSYWAPIEEVGHLSGQVTTFSSSALHIKVKKINEIDTANTTTTGIKISHISDPIDILPPHELSVLSLKKTHATTSNGLNTINHHKATSLIISATHSANNGIIKAIATNNFTKNWSEISTTSIWFGVWAIWSIRKIDAYSPYIGPVIPAAEFIKLPKVGQFCWAIIPCHWALITSSLR